MEAEPIGSSGRHLKSHCLDSNLGLGSTLTSPISVNGHLRDMYLIGCGRDCLRML